MRCDDDTTTGNDRGCKRCGGTGYIAAYAHVAGGVCFECGTVRAARPMPTAAVGELDLPEFSPARDQDYRDEQNDAAWAAMSDAERAELRAWIKANC